MTRAEHRSERHAALDGVVIPLPTPERRFGIDGPYRRGPRSYRPLLAYMAISASCVIASGWLVYARYFK